MRSLHLTIMVFCQILLASYFLYSNLATASPVAQQRQPPQVKPYHLKPMAKQLKELPPKEIVVEAKPEPKAAPIVAVVAEQKPTIQDAVQTRGAEIAKLVTPLQVPIALPESSAEKPKSSEKEQLKARSAVEAPEVKGPVEVVPKPAQMVAAPASPVIVQPVAVIMKEEPVVKRVEMAQPPIQVLVAEQSKPLVAAETPKEQVVLQAAPVAPIVLVPVVPTVSAEPVKPQQPSPAASPQEVDKKIEEVKAPVVELSRSRAPEPEVIAQVVLAPVPVVAPAIPVKEPVAAPKELERKEQPMQPSPQVVTKLEPQQPVVVAPVVKGGLGPLHLLATTLCNYRPDKPVADDTLNQLYCQRAQLRKSLFEFMSLKFTNLEKLSSRLNPGLEVVPPKTVDQSSVVPSHGWPVVGKCTAHDLKLMAEAAWCEMAPVQAASSSDLDKAAPAIVSNKHLRSEGSRHLTVEPQTQQQVVLQPIDQSSVISRILHVADTKDAPVIESSIASLNLTQQQLANIQAQATGDARLCKRNALRLTKALFNHLAEDQTAESESWPKLYTQLYEDDCARRRMIDIITALSGFRSESTTIRRDNVEFAFAMDDLRAKVLETEVHAPLTFDKQFIEIEQFLQQSVKLMLANIDPGRAKLTSMRYRSLMPGPMSADDQCIELHQRLMAKNYPTDCNPTQFGQLPDVLRMTANSLELWSVEKELAKHQNKLQDYPISAPLQPKRTVNECIAHLVSN